MQADIESVLKEYLWQERRVVDEAKNWMEIRGMSYGELGKMKSQVARDMRVPTGEDMLPYLLDQILEMLFHSANVEEVFAEDHEIKKRIRGFLREEEAQDQKLDAEVRAKLRHVQEGTRVWEIEYERMKSEIKRRRGM